MKNNNNGTVTMNLDELMFLGAAAVFGPPDQEMSPELHDAYERYQILVDEEVAKREHQVMDFEDVNMLTKLFVDEA